MICNQSLFGCGSQSRGPGRGDGSGGMCVCREGERLLQVKCSATHGTNLKSSFGGCHTKGSDDH